jgi:hypothetical protein
MLLLVDLDKGTQPNTNGRAILRRRQGEMIDREEQAFYGTDTDSLTYTVTVFDTDRTNRASIDVNDRDNSAISKIKTRTM